MLCDDEQLWKSRFVNKWGDDMSRFVGSAYFDDASKFCEFKTWKQKMEVPWRMFYDQNPRDALQHLIAAG